jgi:hypothetical protein
LILGLAAYFLPAIVAYSRRHQNRFPITLLNLFLGLISLLDLLGIQPVTEVNFLLGLGCVLGWIGALVWSTTANVPRQSMGVREFLTQANENLPQHREPQDYEPPRAIPASMQPA